MNGMEDSKRGFPWLVAIICFVLGVVTGIVVVVGGLTMLSAVSVQTVRNQSRKVACSNNLKQLGLAAQMYLNDHGVFPHAPGGDAPVPGRSHIQLLYDGGYIDDPEVVVCPGTSDPPATMNAQGTCVLGHMTCSYLWAKAKHDDKSPSTAPLAACRVPHGDGDGRNVLYLQGNVRWLPEKEFQKLAPALTPE